MVKTLMVDTYWKYFFFLGIYVISSNQYYVTFLYWTQ